MGIKGIGLATVSGFIAEVGDIGRFDNPKQLQKLAGYAIVANDSGKHNGESRISYRGRKRLRYVLYEAAISLIGKNAEFRAIHEYYRTRKENPLKKMQLLSCKLDAPAPCRLDAPDFSFVCHVLADCLHQHWQAI